MSKKRKAIYYLEDSITGAITSRKGGVPAQRYRKKPFLKDKVVTAKKLKDEFIIKDGKLYDWTTREFVLANPKAAGTPNLYTINSQDFYSGNIRYNRAKITTAIKECFLPYIKHLPEIHKYPVQISMQIHDVVGLANWDVLNRSFIYIKCFEDLIASGRTGKKKRVNKVEEYIQYFKPLIPDDSIKWLAGTGGTTFIPVEKEQDRKLVFFIKHNPIMNSFKFYGGKS